MADDPTPARPRKRTESPAPPPDSKQRPRKAGPGNPVFLPPSTPEEAPAPRVPGARRPPPAFGSQNSGDTATPSHEPRNPSPARHTQDQLPLAQIEPPGPAKATPRKTPTKKATSTPPPAGKAPDSGPPPAKKAAPTPAPAKKTTAPKLPTPSEPAPTPEPTPAPAKKAPAKRPAAKKAQPPTAEPPAKAAPARNAPVAKKVAPLKKAAPLKEAAPAKTAPARETATRKAATKKSASPLQPSPPQPTPAAESKVTTPGPVEPAAEAVPVMPSPAVFSGELLPAQPRPLTPSNSDLATTAPSLRDFRDRPMHAAELLALTAVAHYGPSAAASIGWLREQYPNAASDGLARAATQRFVRQARKRGAVAGLAGTLAVLVDAGTLHTLHADLILHVAAAYGHDPTAPERAAELLYLLGVHDSAAEASTAVSSAIEPASTVTGDPTRLVLPLARTLTLGVLRVGARRVLRLIPGAGALIGAVANARATEEVVTRALRFYRNRG